MFSGIIEEFATVVAIRKDRENIDFTLKCSFVDELKIDQSVAHNGVCLTVVAIENGTYTVTAMKETLDRTNLGLLKVGDKVNVERPMLMNGRLTVISSRDMLTRQLAALQLRMPMAQPISLLSILKTERWQRKAILLSTRVV